MPIRRPPRRRINANAERARRRSLLGVAAVILLIGLTASGLYSLVGPARAPTSIGGPFTLVDSSGHTVTSTSWHGKYLLVYFGYTFCPDVCPTTLTTLAAALDRLGPTADRVQPLFITVDPRRDTQAVLAGYTAAFSPRLLGLTGTKDQIAQVTAEYRVYFAKHKTGPGENDYVMDHSSVFYLIAPNGKIVSILSADQQAAAMAAQLSQHLS
jgi:protein SCO1/2